ncbi:hypothetical protein BDV96DRAFT_354359 [Lophiotrema nucula]|uniref:Uncharacterized protein n=1 Tax=Lophiotrema nucula TaxID=690887 RepID=A0A6A5YF37_9PLEO|nr:hypothetical protein BDV96DRAFT_354359 [Lophiotrema nucula]
MQRQTRPSMCLTFSGTVIYFDYCDVRSSSFKLSCFSTDINFLLHTYHHRPTSSTHNYNHNQPYRMLALKLIGFLLAYISFAASFATLSQSGEALTNNTLLLDTRATDQIIGGAEGLDRRRGPISCHNKADAIGPPCQFEEINFKAAARVYCGLYKQKYIVPIGQSYPRKISLLPCGKSQCTFWGNIKFTKDVDNRGAGNGWNYIDYERCYEHVDDIYRSCGGYGGWYNTGYGTMFAECINQ